MNTIDATQLGDQNGNFLELPTANTLENDVRVPVQQVPQKAKRYSFTKSISNNIDTTLFDLIQTGTGQTVNQTSGNLVLGAGTTARSETIIRSKQAFSGALRFTADVQISQRNANNNFYFELVDKIGDGLAYTINSATSITVTIPGHTFTSENIGQFMTIGAFNGTGTFVSGRYAIASITGDDVTYTVAGFAVGTGTCSIFGWNFHKMHYTAATATSMLFNSQKNGWATTDNTATILTTATGHIVTFEADITFSALMDKSFASSAAIQVTQRGTNARNLPDSDTELYLQIRSQNGTTAPTATTLTVGFILIEDYIPQQVEIVGVKPQSSSEGLPTRSLGGSMTVSGSVTANGGTSFANPVVNNTGDTGAKTTIGVTNGATQTNTYTKGAQIVVNLGTVTGTGQTIIFKVQGSADSGTTWYDIPGATTTTLTATGVYGICIYPGITDVTGTTTSGTTACISALLPRTWRMVWTIGGTSPSFTITNIQVSSIL